MRYLGADEAAELAFRLEKMGRDGNLEEVEPVLAGLQQEMAKLIPVLLNYVRVGEVPGDSDTSAT